MTPAGWITRDGVRLAVYSGGTEGPPLVFQHGLCGDVGQVAEAMGAARWTGLECRGHGASGMGDVSIAQFADDVAALIETLDAPVVLGGISMGAAIATRIAVLRPELVRALVLVRPAWVAESAPDNMRPNAEVGALLGQFGADVARGIFADGDTARRLARDAPDNLLSLMGFFDRAPQVDTATLLTTIAADGPGISRDDLAALRVPALVCGTAMDAIHPFSHAQDLATLIPHARLVDLPPKAQNKAAHLVALRAAMTSFLKELPHAPPRI